MSAVKILELGFGITVLLALLAAAIPDVASTRNEAAGAIKAVDVMSDVAAQSSPAAAGRDQDPQGRAPIVLPGPADNVLAGP